MINNTSRTKENKMLKHLLEKPEAELRCIEAPKIEGDFLLVWEGEPIIGDIGYIFDYIEEINLHVHWCDLSGSIINIAIHDLDEWWHEQLLPVSRNQYKQEVKK